MYRALFYGRYYMPVVQMMKLRYKVVKLLPEITSLASGRVRIGTQVIWL